MLDFAPILSHLQQDPILAVLLARQPLPAWAPTRRVFHHLIRSIVSQQLSVKAAATIHGRFLELVGGEDFSPETILLQTPTDLRAVGLSKQKSQYLLNVADFFEAQELLQTDWSKWTDEMIIKKLTEIKGVGEWTVQMILMFSLGRLDVLPLGDLAIRQSMVELYGLEEDQFSKKALFQELEQIASPWRPYRTIACRYLWDARSASPLT